ncbi:MAG TPA: hypothetical protein VLJ11_18005 [Bryobacteraceae bacterium]|nr:hypothetical protein [Bryobacteraceae bacterium]
MYGTTELRDLSSAATLNSKLTTASVPPEEAGQNGWNGHNNPDGTVLVGMCLQCQLDH